MNLIFCYVSQMGFVPRVLSPYHTRLFVDFFFYMLPSMASPRLADEVVSRFCGGYCIMIVSFCLGGRLWMELKVQQLPV
ncbi:hypothetical protein ANPL_04195 [Anaplasma platys]|uniref:Uncharacterized protein n=1 Tax=Anaplasma platys TaxID=949 RepID=A0A858PZ58_9RICK|nr:hypothetical protein ANPL_04195 [Anaplasma platys]